MQKKRSSKQKVQLEHQLAGYAAQAAGRLAKVERHQQPKTWVAYAAAAGAALAMAPVADAIPVYSGVQNLMLEVAGSVDFKSQGIDFDGDGIYDVYFGIFRYLPASLGVAYLGSGSYGSVAVDGSYSARKFASGNLIGPSAVFSTSGALRGAFLGAPYGRWESSEPNAFAGVRFLAGYTYVPSLSTSTFIGGTRFAWLRIHMQDDAGFPNKITLIDWAFESDPDTPIPAGAGAPAAVPEPSTGSLALLALGAMGLYEWRRRRKQQTPQA